MIDTLLYLLCGLVAGVLGGYLGLGGGIVMVPFLTVITGLPIKTAVPVSIAAIVVNSIAASTEYLRRGMVDLELVVILAIFMSMGNVAGSLLSTVVPTNAIQLTFTLVLVYTAVAMLRNRRSPDKRSFGGESHKKLPVAILLILATGTIAGLLGIGGGVIIIPLLFLVVGIPLATARGTSAFMIGFSAAAATVVYFISGRLEFQIAAPVITGIIIGGKIGGYFGTLAKPLVIKIIFFVVMLYLAVRLGYQPLMELL